MLTIFNVPYHAQAAVRFQYAMYLFHSRLVGKPVEGLRAFSPGSHTERWCGAREVMWMDEMQLCQKRKERNKHLPVRKWQHPHWHLQAECYQPVPFEP